MLSNRKLILIIVLMVVATVAAYLLLVVIPRRMAEQTYDGARKRGHDWKEALQFTPEVRVDHVIILEQQSEIMELATL